MSVENIFIHSAVKRFLTYKELGEKTFKQLKGEHFFVIPAEGSNSIAMIVQHMHGNMMSRWTDLLTSDGEKEWRKRDDEFEEIISDVATLLRLWNEGWACLFAALECLKPDDLEKTIYIRSELLTVIDAINKQLAHYPYHVGQIVYIGKMMLKESFVSLSIPKKS